MIYTFQYYVQIIVVLIKIDVQGSIYIGAQFFRQRTTIYLEKQKTER